MGEGLDAGPFILGSYSVTAILVIGYSVWQVLLRKKLRQLEKATLEGER